ncbi:hypothetical protein [Thermaurantiacus sp.]|jgi:hypothetical protein
MRKPVNWMQLLGGVFVGLAIYRFFTGDGWIVWAILGFLFGGFDLLFGRKTKGDKP